MGLGTYVPALHLLEYLRAKGHVVSMEVFESYFGEDVMKKYLKNKKEYHKSFKVAKLGHKLAEKKLSTVLDSDTEEKIMNRWKKEEAYRFVILSGNWASTVRKYRGFLNAQQELQAVIVHMDLGIAPSWKHVDNSDGFFTEIKQFDEEGICFFVETPYQRNVSLGELKRPAFFFHGGGWGMGDYREKKQELQQEKNCFVLELAHEREEMKPCEKTKYYLMDPQWKPWIPMENGEFSFPVMIAGDNGEILDNHNMKGLYQLYEECAAIITKPGGGSFADSIITGIPLVTLEPIAEHERKNQDALERLELSISFAQWRKSGFSMKVLQQIQKNIIKNRQGKIGLGAYMERIMH